MPTVSDIDQQIADLEAKKRQLIADEKRSALKKVQLAIQELNALGFSYSLVEGQSSTGTRRTGIRQQVLALIQKAPTTRADVIQALDAAGDKKAQQSISNALANLKKTGAVSLVDGTYTAK